MQKAAIKSVDIFVRTLIKDFVFRPSPMAHQYMRNFLTKVMATYAVLLVELSSFICLMLDKLLFCQSYWLRFVRLPRKISLRVFHCFFEVLEGLFVRVDKHFVI